MPGTNDTDDLELELDDEGDGEGDEGGEPETDSKPDPKKGKVEDQIKNLQSRADKEAARANKAEKALKEALKALGQGEQPDGDGEPATGKPDPERAALMQEIREAGLDAVYAENPLLKTYGIERDLVQGASRAEMRESATALVALIKSIETKAKNAALAEHGITPEPVSGKRTPPKSYDQMSDEEFEKEIARARGGGASLW